MSTAIYELDETELKALSDRYAGLTETSTFCACGQRICVDDEMCADCQRERERELRAKAFYLTQDEIAKTRSQYKWDGLKNQESTI